MTKVAKSSNRGPRPGERRGGRKKGTPNHVTTDVRATIALIARRNVEAFERWLTAVAGNDPARAADLFLRMIEYHIPKLQRSEVTGADGAALVPPEIHVHFPTTQVRR